MHTEYTLLSFLSKYEGILHFKDTKDYKYGILEISYYINYKNMHIIKNTSERGILQVDFKASSLLFPVVQFMTITDMPFLQLARCKNI